MSQVQSLGYWTATGSGLRPSGFTWQLASASLAGDVIQVWINSSPSNHCISHCKAQVAQLFFIQHLICTYWIKGILCGYAIRSAPAADFPRDVCLTVSRNHKVFLLSLIARFMGPTWVPSGADRTQVGPMFTPWTLLYRMWCYENVQCYMLDRCHFSRKTSDKIRRELRCDIRSLGLYQDRTKMWIHKEFPDSKMSDIVEFHRRVS